MISPASTSVSVTNSPRPASGSSDTATQTPCPTARPGQPGQPLGFLPVLEAIWGIRIGSMTPCVRWQLQLVLPLTLHRWGYRRGRSIPSFGTGRGRSALAHGSLRAGSEIVPCNPFRAFLSVGRVGRSNRKVRYCSADAWGFVVAGRQSRPAPSSSGIRRPPSSPLCAATCAGVGWPMPSTALR